MKKTLAIALSAAAICSVMLTAGCGRTKPNANNTGAMPSGSVSQTDNIPMLPNGSDNADTP